MTELPGGQLLPPPLPLPEGAGYVSLRVQPENYPALAAALSQHLELPASLRTAVAKRQALWLAGRWCALQALQAAGCLYPKIPGTGEMGEPLWPMGWVGSISHSDTHVSAAVAPTQHCAGLGLDNESLIAGKTLDAVRERISLPAERLHPPAQWSEQLWYTLIFSAKESLFKALYPQVKKFFGFEAARLEGIAAGRLRMRLMEDLGAGLRAGQLFTGVWAEQPGQVFTAIWLEQDRWLAAQ